jgi:hypothetical protein
MDDESRHTGTPAVEGRPLDPILADIVYDPTVLWDRRQPVEICSFISRFR